MPAPEKRTLEQKRAEYSLGKIDGVKTRSPADQAKYKSQLLKLPARLHTNGLGQTVAFYLAAGKDKPEWEICAWLGAWLAEQGIYPKNTDLIRSLTGDSEALYRRASVEARALAVWLKRFAEAFLQEEENTRADSSTAAAGAGAALQPQGNG